MRTTRPTLLLDEQKCKSNIAMMAEKAFKNNIVLRPHFKTHVSHKIGEWFREAGIQSITVSSFHMAEYFARVGWRDITVAFPVNIHEIAIINSLAANIQLNILLESVESVQFLNQHLQYPVGMFIAIDVDYYRTGIHWRNIDEIKKVIEQRNDKNLKIKGLLTHAGQSYSARGAAEILTIHKKSLEKMRFVKNNLNSQYPELIISIGDTPTCSVAQEFDEVNEIRPGNFVFYDLMQQQIGACNYDQIALAMACPVVSKHPQREEIVIYGGGVHFSKDLIQHESYGIVYGLAANTLASGWGNPIPNVYITRLSQEHGIIKAPTNYINHIKIGDIITILPVHSCMTADMFQTYQTTSGNLIPRMEKY